MANTTPNAVYSGSQPARQVTITAASNATPIVITAANHGATSGNLVTVTSVGGNTAANVTGNAVTVIDRNNFSLDGTVGNGAYTSGGSAEFYFSGIVAQALTGSDAQRVFGTASSTGDNSGAAFTLNFIDGTAALPFTPTGILATRIGGSQAASTAVASAAIVDAKTATITATATLGAASTFQVAFCAFK